MMTQETTKKQSTKVWEWAAFIALFVLCCFTRLYNLDYKTIMHDEALFVYYTYYQLYKEISYQYLPILHGPAMLHLQTLTYHIFGDSDYVMRLGCAILGIAGFFWVAAMRPWLGSIGIWIALTFYTLSPGITYYQRFYRNDALYLFNSLWIVTSLLYWWRHRNPAWLASAIIGCTVLFTNKESSLFVYFSIITFVVLWIMVDLISGVFSGKEDSTVTRPQPLIRFANPSWFVLVFFATVTLIVTQVFEGIRYDSDVVKAIGHNWALRDIRSIPLALGWVTHNPGSLPDAAAASEGAFWRRFYLLLFLSLFVSATVAKFAVERRWGRTEMLTGLWSRLVAARFYFIGALAFSAAWYLLIFTTYFQKDIGFLDIYSITWSYWGGQHEWGRIGGPFHQHLLNMLIYELPSVIIVGLTWLIGMFVMKWNRVQAFSVLLFVIPVAAFHKLIFSGMSIDYGGGQALQPLEIDILKTLVLLLLGGAVLIFCLPKAGRVLFPAGFLFSLFAAINFINSPEWSTALTRRIYQGGQPVVLGNRQVSLNDFMEVSFNFDGGTSLVIVLVLTVFATVYTWSLIGQGRLYKAFLTWWFVTATGAACYAREAVPQVGIHAMLPLILLASVIGNDLYHRANTAVARRFLIGGFVLASLITAKSTFTLNFYYPDEPRERMVYGPTPQDVKQHCDFILDYRKIAGVRKESDGVISWIRYNNDPTKEKDLKVGVEADVVVWPVRWYLRDVEWRENKNVQQLIDQNFHFIFATPAKRNSVPDLADKYHIFDGSGMRFWLPRQLSKEKLFDLWLNIIPDHRIDGTNLAQKASDSKAEWNKIVHYMLSRRTFQGHDPGAGSMSGTDYLFCVRKDLY